MFPADDETEREAATMAGRQSTFDTDREFGRLLEALGGEVTGGAGLTHSSNARTIMRGPTSGTLLTHGPYTPGVGQLSGFFIVSCDDYDALVDIARVLTRAHPVVEIRPVQQY